MNEGDVIKMVVLEVFVAGLYVAWSVGQIADSDNFACWLFRPGLDQLTKMGKWTCLRQCLWAVRVAVPYRTTWWQDTRNCLASHASHKILKEGYHTDFHLWLQVGQSRPGRCKKWATCLSTILKWPQAKLFKIVNEVWECFRTVFLCHSYAQK